MSTRTLPYVLTTLAADRPANPGNDPVFHRATDTGEVALWSGSDWMPLDGGGEGGGGEGGGGGGGPVGVTTVDVVITTPVADSRRVTVTTRDGEGNPVPYQHVRLDLMTNLADVSGVTVTGFGAVWITRVTSRFQVPTQGFEVIGNTDADGEIAVELAASGIALSGIQAASCGAVSGGVTGV